MFKHKKQLLTEIYGLDKDEVEKMSKKEIDRFLVKKQKEDLQNNKNPNKFWIINGLPSPKTTKTTTSSKVGFWFIIVFVLVLLLTFAVFMFIAFS